MKRQLLQCLKFIFWVVCVMEHKTNVPSKNYTGLASLRIQQMNI